jgi:hypothetical protein
VTPKNSLAKKQIPCGDDRKKSNCKGKDFDAKGAKKNAKDATVVIAAAP